MVWASRVGSASLTSRTSAGTTPDQVTPPATRCSPVPTTGNRRERYWEQANRRKSAWLWEKRGISFLFPLFPLKRASYARGTSRIHMRVRDFSLYRYAVFTGNSGNSGNTAKNPRNDATFSHSSVPTSVPSGGNTCVERRMMSWSGARRPPVRGCTGHRRHPARWKIGF